MSPAFGQVSISTDAEESIGGNARAWGWSPLHGITASNGYLYVMHRNDGGTDYSILYSSDRGVNWSILDATLLDYGDNRLGQMVSYSDTVYAWGSNNGAPVAPNEIFKIYGTSVVARDTLDSTSYSAMFIRELPSDTIMYVKKTSNYYLSTNWTDGRLLEGATWNKGDSTILLDDTNQEHWAFTPVSDGILGIMLSDAGGGAGSYDTAYFWNTTEVYIVDESITDNMEELGNQNTSIDFIQMCPADPDDATNDTCAFVMQNDSTNRVEFVIGYVDPTSSYAWTEIRRTWVNTAGITFVLTTPGTHSSPCLQRTPDGVWIVYYGYWSSTDKGIAYKYSDDDGATWSDEQILLTASASNAHMRYRCSFITPEYASGDSILVGVAYQESWTNDYNLYWIGSTIGNIAIGGAEAGPPYFPGVK